MATTKSSSEEIRKGTYETNKMSAEEMLKRIARTGSESPRKIKEVCACESVDQEVNSINNGRN